MSAIVDGALSLPPKVVGDDLVEGPHVDKVEQLGEKLDGEGGVDATLPEQGHGRGQNLDKEAKGLVTYSILLAFHNYGS